MTSNKSISVEKNDWSDYMLIDFALTNVVVSDTIKFYLDILPQSSLQQQKDEVTRNKVGEKKGYL